jgi:uncharacterized protein
VPPAPTARVNDYAGLLSSADRDRLERVMAEREGATGAQMAIAIFRSLDGQSLEDFSVRLAQQWRIGRKGLDNGAILVVFVNDRKLRLEIGYGLEPLVPDAAAGQIIREALAPRFREGRYAAGLEAAVHAVFDRAGTGGRPPAGRPRPFTVPPWTVLGAFVLVAALAVILLWEVRRQNRYARRYVYTAGRDGWSTPASTGPTWWGHGGGGVDVGGFSGGGGSFGGGGASGRW